MNGSTANARPAIHVTIAGTGIAVPGTVLTAEQLDQRMGLPHGESCRITGIRQRHMATQETAAELAAQAIKQVLKNTNMNWDQIDCMVCASATMDQALPYNAAMILAELGPQRHHLSTMDIGASCLSFVQALDMVSCALAVGRYKNVLIVSSDISTFTTDYHNLRENGIFGDGAAAVIVRRSLPGESSAILASRSITLPQGVDYCRIRTGGSRYHRRGNTDHAQALFEMQGRALFKLVRRELPGFVEALLNDANVSREELALFVPHQASRQALDHIARMLGFDDGRMVDIVGEFGNQVGASLPTALHFAVQRYGLQRGHKVLLLGTGAGVSIGGMVLVY